LQITVEIGEICRASYFKHPILSELQR
jgi:hypothetical protein